jgi:ABC-type dipeptide/oligopeptide/nickel transport system permease subunit
LFFGLAFLAPLVAQVMVRLDVNAPFALSPLQFGLIIGTVLGLIATYRGKWI